MPRLHDSTFRSDIVKRLRSLRPDSQRKFGKMSVDQMLWHVNCALENALGTRPIAAAKIPIPKPVLKFIVMNLPWKPGNPTAPEFMATTNHDFESERTKCIQLVEALAAKPMDEPWDDHPAFGGMSGRDVSRLQAKHLNHHLAQFGA